MTWTGTIWVCEMLGYELSSIISLVPAVYQFYQGVYCLKSLPKKLKKRCFFFLNIGNHWVTVYRNKHWELFNPLGTDHNFIVQNLKYKGTWQFNTTRVQAENSSICGLFCVAFSFYRVLNEELDLEDVLNSTFSKHTKRNERRVKKICKKIEKQKFVV